MSSMKPKEWGLLIILSVCWGGSFFFVEVALRGFQPFTLVFLRISIAALILAGVVCLTGKRLPKSFKTWGGYVVMGALANAIPFSLTAWGQTRIESGVASILNATTPIFSVLLAHFLTSDERMTANKILGVLIGFIGVYLMMKPELTDGFSWRGLGQTAVLGAAICYGLGAIFGKRFKNIPAVVNSAGMLICSSIMMLPLVFIVNSPWSLRPPLEAIIAVLGIAVISTVLAYLLYFYILSTAGATNVLLVTFLIPVSALLLGVGILGEVIKELEYAGMGCIFLGLIVIDGRTLSLVMRLNRRRTTGKRKEAASKAVG